MYVCSGTCKPPIESSNMAMYVCSGTCKPPVESIVYALTFTGLNFLGLPVFAIFAVCDITAHPLPVWSKFSPG